MAQANFKPELGQDSGIAALEGELLTLIRRVTTRRVDLPGAPSLERSAYTVLQRIRDCGPQRGSDLAAGLGLDLSTISRQCSQLAEAGLLTKTDDPRDGRAHLLALTAAGRRLVDRVQAARRRALSARLAGWPAADVTELARLIHRLNDDLTQLSQDPAEERR